MQGLPSTVEPPHPVHDVHRQGVPRSPATRVFLLTTVVAVVDVLVLHGVAGAPPADHLHDEHPERVHVRVEAGAAGEEALVRHVAAGPRHDLCGVACDAVVLDDAGEAEVP